MAGRRRAKVVETVVVKDEAVDAPEAVQEGAEGVPDAEADNVVVVDLSEADAAADVPEADGAEPAGDAADEGGVEAGVSAKDALDSGAVPFVKKLPRGFGQCEWIEGEPNREGARIPVRPLNDPAFWRDQCDKAARYRLANQLAPSVRGGIYCYDHVLEEVARSESLQEMFDSALAGAVS